MVITYYGLSCFKIQSGETIIGFDPPSKKVGVKVPRFGADIILQSHNHDGHNGTDQLFSEEKKSFIIDGPGEYEIKGVSIQGFNSFHDSFGGKRYGVNTVYSIRLEDINLCFLGDFGEKGLRPELKEGIGKADILFAPIGGKTVLDTAEAKDLINQTEPSIVIPMHYHTAKKSEDILKEFAIEFGQKNIEPMEKLSIRKKDIKEGSTQIIILKPAL